MTVIDSTGTNNAVGGIYNGGGTTAIIATITYSGPRSRAAARAGHRFRLIQGGGTGGSPGEPARRPSLVPPASQIPPPAPSGL